MKFLNFPIHVTNLHLRINKFMEPSLILFLKKLNVSKLVINKVKIKIDMSSYGRFRVVLKIDRIAGFFCYRADRGLKASRRVSKY